MERISVERAKAALELYQKSGKIDTADGPIEPGQLAQEFETEIIGPLEMLGGETEGLEETTQLAEVVKPRAMSEIVRKELRDSLGELYSKVMGEDSSDNGSTAV